MAVSKTISKYNALEEYAVGRRLFKTGLAIMLATGLLAFFILYMLAPMLAEHIIPDDDLTSNVKMSFLSFVQLVLHLLLFRL